MLQKRALVILLLFCVSLPFSAQAHSGRTDSDGGHWNHDTWEYHYHHGYGPHQHIDGVCPYKFDDQTGQNSGSSGGGSKSESGGGGSSSKGGGGTSAKESSSSGAFWRVALFFGGLFVLWRIIGFVWRREDRAKEKIRRAEAEKAAALERERREKRKAEEARAREERARQWKLQKEQEERERAERIARADRERLERFEREKSRYQELYAGKTVLEIAGAPLGVEISADGLPRLTGAERWGKTFTFFIAPKGKTFHAKKGCNESAIYPLNAVSIRASKRVPCSKCRPVLPDLAWYDKCDSIRANMRKYGIEELAKHTSDD